MKRTGLFCGSPIRHVACQALLGSLNGSSYRMVEPGERGRHVRV